MLEFCLGNADAFRGFFIGKEGNTRDGRSFLDSSLILPLYMSGEELIWEAAMMIFICDIAPAVADV